MTDYPRRSRSCDLAILGLCSLAACVASLTPWFLARQECSEEPFSVSVMYRAPEGDVQYFPLAKELSRGTLTEQCVKEPGGTFIRSFPLIPLAPHALCIACCGDGGFVLADVVVTVLYFLAAFSFFRCLSISSTVSSILSLALALRIPFYVSIRAQVGPLEGFLPLLSETWGNRFPRPFVSEVFLLFALAATTAAARPRNRYGTIRWILLGAALSLLVQSDMYAGFVLILSLPLVLLCARNSERMLAAKVASSILVFLALSAFFIFQRLVEHPDIPPRWGVISVSRWPPVILWTHLFRPLIPIAVLLLGEAALRRHASTCEESLGIEKAECSQYRTLIRYFLGLLIIAAAAIPLFTVASGRAVQLYHFTTITNTLCGYIMAGAVGVALDISLRVLLKRREWSKSVRNLFCGLGYTLPIVLLFVCIGFRAAGESWRYAGHLGPKRFNTVNPVGDSYRSEFAELIEFLAAREEVKAGVLASLDNQVFSWWLTFTDGFSFLADPFVSAVPDHEVEMRLGLFCKLLGMSSDEYAEFLRTGYVEFFWLSNIKYQASRLHTYGKPSDYTTEELSRIRNTSEQSAMYTIIPRREIDRLRTNYESLARGELGRRQLDLIVLNNDEAQINYVPPRDSWALVFENACFRAYSRAAP